MYEELRSRLVEIRTERGLSMEQVGRKFGSDKQRVYNWEKGRSQPSLEMLSKWAAALGCRLAVLVLPAEAPLATEELVSALGPLDLDDQREVVRFAMTLRRAQGMSRRLLLGHLHNVASELEVEAGVAAAVG
jgi:transcriptional regulator with XRE-family HTH domain